MHDKSLRLVLLLIAGAIILTLLPRCEYHNEEELYGTTECDTSDYSYSTFILPLLEENDCIACHSLMDAKGNVILEGYDNLMESLNDGSFLGAIRHDPGYEPMPEGLPKLPECDILKVELWVNAGAPNN